jgi:hypothetical protein
MTIAIEQFRVGRELWLDLVLLRTFRGPAAAYAINWRKAAQNSGSYQEASERTKRTINKV